MVYQPERLADLAHALDLLRGADIRLYLSPMSRTQLALARSAGRSDEIERWRRDVASLAAARSVPLSDLIDCHPFDDFSPELGSSPAWFDNVHFKPVVGRWVLGRIGLLRDG
jgi:hypothetical protein